MSDEAVYLTQALVDGNEKAFSKYITHKSVKSWINEKIFLDELENVEFPDGYDYTTSLLYAVANSSTRKVRDIVAVGANMHIRDSFKNTLLHCACASNVDRLEKVRYLILLDPSQVKERNAHGSTPVHFAALNGFDDVIGEIVSHGADINATGQFGNSPVHAAAEKGFVKVIKELVYNDADVRAQNDARKTALHIAAENGETECLTLLIDAYKVQVNTQDSDGVTALHLAAYWGNLKAVKILASYPQCDLNVKNKWGKIALEEAQAENHQDVVEYLLTLQEDPKQEIENNSKYTDEQFARLENMIQNHTNVTTELSGNYKNIKKRMDVYQRDLRDWKNSKESNRRKFENEINERKKTIIDLNGEIKELRKTVQNQDKQLHSLREATGRLCLDESSLSEAKTLAERFRANLDYLIENVDTRDHIDHLFSKKALDMDDMEIIKTTKGPNKRVSKMMSLFYEKKDPSWAPILLESFKRQERWHHIVDEIQKMDMSTIRKKEIK